MSVQDDTNTEQAGGSAAGSEVVAAGGDGPETLADALSVSLSGDESGDNGAEAGAAGEAGAVEPGDGAVTEPGAAEGEAGANEPGDGAAAEPGAEAAAGGKEAGDKETGADEVSDEEFIASLSERGQARFRRLTDERNQFRQAAEQGDKLRVMLNEHIADPNDFAQMLDISRCVKNGDFRGALGLIDQARNRIAIQAGVVDGPPDVLSAYPDLVKGVEEFQYTKEAAVEIARLRDQERQRLARQEQQQTEQAQFQAAEQERQQVLQNIEAQEQEWARTDPDYEAKMALLGPEVQRITQQYPMNAWQAAISDAYRNVQAPAAVKPTPSPNPLRPVNTGGGGAKEPESMADALLGVLN